MSNKTLFNDWKIDGFLATSPDGKYQLWVANGFSYFEDYYPHYPHYPKETLLAGIGKWQKYKIWRELCRERKLRAKNFLTNL